MIKRKNLKSQRGFSLIEVVMGMLILSVGLLLLLPMMVVSMQANDFARGSTEASMLIKDKMEELKNMNNPTAGADSVSGAYRTWTVTNIDNKLAKLVVNISWNDFEGRSHSNSMVSYMVKD
jgi:prepilin-type N-terminal cleavage/methylation domain-containing protein